MNEKEKQQDRRQALAVVFGAYGTAQGGLAILKLTVTVQWPWSAILIPTWIFSGLLLAAVLIGTILGVRRYIRAEKEKRKTLEVISRSLSNQVKKILQDLEDEEEEE